MIFNFFSSERPLLVPDVVQTSYKDAGAASLKALLDGFGIAVKHDRLSEALHIETEATSIDILEKAALQLGLQAEQMLVPPEHVLLPEAKILPALIVVRQPNGRTHFVVGWNKLGSFIQVMDPATGRKWLTGQRLLDELHRHTMPVSAKAWRAWAASEEFQAPLRHRLVDLGISTADIAHFTGTALTDPDWPSLAALDAATRTVTAAIRAKGVDSGEAATTMLTNLFQQARQMRDVSFWTASEVTTEHVIPPPYWFVLPCPPNTNQAHDGDEQVLLHGAVVLRILGKEAVSAADTEQLKSEEETLSPELNAARQEQNIQTNRRLWETLRADGLLAPGILLTALIIAGAGVAIEALLFRGIMEIGDRLELVGQRTGAVAILIIFFMAFILLQFSIVATTLRLGRHLETRLRVAFLEKVPRLSDQYFHSRPVSDLTQRAHSLRQIRRLPGVGAKFLELFFQFLFTTLGIIWLDPASTPLVILILVLNAAIVLSLSPLMTNPNYRFQLHGNQLSRFYLDALLGLVPIRTHGTERALRSQLDSKLVEWTYRGRNYFRVVTVVQGVAGFIFSALTVWLLFSYVKRGSNANNLLLLAYWILSLPELLTQVSLNAVQYPHLHNIARMLFEPLAAPDEVDSPAERRANKTQANTASPQSPAAAIAFKNVSVQVGGQTLLQNINLEIQPGEHIGIVGPSGAGKSTLVGLLLGWHQPVTGQVEVDGLLLDRKTLPDLRRETIWVDPAIQIWNRSLLYNLYYGTSSTDFTLLGSAIEQADLLAVLKKFPDGLQTPLGEAGGLVSGGEGQRVRLGRAMFRQTGRLVILDEPFRGLDRDKRRELLKRCRQFWAGATLICITHDVGEIQAFERVLVVEDGRVIEDAAPGSLVAQPNSRYRALLEAEEAVREGLWSTATWRRLWLAEGKVQERDGSRGGQ